jgi:hypothetical protein
MEAASILRLDMSRLRFLIHRLFPVLEIKAEALRCNIELALRLANMM